MANKPKQLIVNIDDLIVNESNPRILPVDTELDAIFSILNDQGKKIISLAEDIVLQGLSPLELIGAVESKNGKFKVKEGNRRITAIKLLKDPYLIEKQYPKLFDEFSKLSTKIHEQELKNINCIVAKNDEDLDHWMEIKHLGLQGGKGLDKWNAIQTDRHKARKNDSSPEYKFLDYIVMENFISFEDAFVKINLTNWKRVFGSIGREYMGLAKENNTIYIIDENLFKQIIPIVVNKLEKATVKIVYDGEAIEEFFINIYTEFNIKKTSPEQLSIETSLTSNINDENSNKTNEVIEYEEVDPINDTIDQSNIVEVESVSATNNLDLCNENTIDNDLISANKNIPTRYTSYRNVIIPETEEYYSNQYTKLNDIIKELKKLNTTIYPNATAVLLRVFIELSFKQYAEENNILYDKNTSLDKVIKDSIQQMRNKKLIANNVHSNIITLIKKQDFIVILNGYIHYPNVIVNKTLLIELYDTLSPALRVIF